MANSDTRFGLRAVGHLMGIDWNNAVRRCFIPYTDNTRAFFMGDPVDLAGSSDAVGECPTVTVANCGAASYPLLGAIIGFEPNPDDLSLTYRPNEKDRYCFVSCDPFTVYEIQGCSGAVLGATSVGLNAVMIATHTGDTKTGLSGMELDSGASAGPSANSTYPLLILGKVPRADNDISAVNAKWHVLISMHRLLPNWSPTDAAYFGAKGA